MKIVSAAYMSGPVQTSSERQKIIIIFNSHRKEHNVKGI